MDSPAPPARGALEPPRYRPHAADDASARWAALEAAFDAAHPLPAPERAARVAELERDDPAMAAELRALLAADAAPGPMDLLAPRLASLGDVLDDALGASAAPAAAGPGTPGDAGAGDDTLPARVGPYVVAGEIGRGGMGVVCRAHDRRLGRDVALKVFPHDAGGAAAEERVLAEARAASALDHPHICTIYDVGSLPDGRPYLAMAYYAGGTLADRLTAGPLSPREAARVAAQLADALACAHAAGIVHRDVKPRNVAFGERGEAKLLDFGVAVLRDRGGPAGSAGTPAYMAPEQVRGESVDGRADVWALGVVLFEMLAARRPFAGADRRAVLRAILHDDAPDLQAARPDAPAALSALVARALRRDPAERPAGAAAMAAELRAYLAGPERAATLQRPWRRRAALTLGSGAAGAGLVALAALAWARGAAGREDARAAEGVAAPGAGAGVVLIGDSPLGGRGVAAAVAVIPFSAVNEAGPDSAVAYLADGVAEDVLTALARVPGLVVRSPASSARFRGGAADARAAGRALGARYLLQGSVRRSGDRLRVSARLVDAAADRQLWAEAYHRRAADLLALQGEIAAEIAHALGARVAAGDAAAAPPPRDPDAYDLLLRARERVRAGTPEGMEEAIALLTTALARDPDYAAAHALLSRAQVRAAQPGGSREGRRAWMDSGAAHARRAAALAPAAAEGYAALGNAYSAMGREPEAVAQYRRALDLDPRHAQAMLDLAQSYLALDRLEEAFRWLERALAVDPALTEARVYAVGRYRMYGLPDEARRHLHAGLRLDPHNLALQWHGVVLEQRAGDTAAARRLLDATLPLRPPAERAQLRAWDAMNRGDARAARPWVDRVAGTGATAHDRYLYGVVYRLTGDPARGDSLLRVELGALQRAERAGRRPPPRALLTRAYLHAVLGEREPALAALARWDAAGGADGWDDLRLRAGSWGAGWASVRGDPRFGPIVARSQARLARTRERVRAGLAGDGPAAVAVP